ncbi:MAG: hypothetical protein ACK5NB_04610 [Flavobacteriaceae bacterium]
MLKTIKFITALLAFTPIVSCGGGVLSSANLNEKEGLDVVQEKLTANFTDIEFTQLDISTNDALSSGFNSIYVEYFDAAIEKTVNQDYLKSTGILSDPKPKNIQRGKGESFKQSDINWENTLQKITEALNGVAERDGEEYENFTLHRIEFEKKKGNLVQTFDISMTKKGEGTTRNGRTVTTNYYEVEATVNTDGTITYEDK